MLFSLDSSQKLGKWGLELYPDLIQEQIKMEAEFIAKGAGQLHITVSPYFAHIDGRNHYSTITRYYSPENVMTHTDELIINRDEVNTLNVTYSKGTLEIVLNGKTFSFSSKYDPTIDQLGITLPEDSVFTRLEASGTKTNLFPKSPRAKNFTHGMAMGFAATEVQAVCDKEWLAKAIKAIADLGVKRLYWIYMGGVDHGFWDPVGGYFIYKDKDVEETFASIGRNPLALATEYAHENGLEIYALIKPLDMAVMGFTFPPGSELASKYGKLDVLGGRVFTGQSFPAKHPELLMRRRPVEDQIDPVAKIVIEPNNKQAKLPTNIELWVSKDNWKYHKYDKPCQVDKTNGMIAITGLEIREKFMAISVPGNKDERRIENTLDKLVTVYDTKGKRVTFTYGLSPRKYTMAVGPNSRPGGVFQDDGIQFDWLAGTSGIPSACLSGGFIPHAFFALDNRDGVIGIAIGKNQYMSGTMSPSEPKARAYWLNLISEALDYGIDGVDLRVQGHTNILEWKEYGFNPPVVAEYKKRYGVDILTEEFDMGKLRILRGEFYTHFLREVKQMTRQRGKKLQLHIFEMIEGTPDTPTLAEIHFDWRRWLEEGIPDQVTYKYFNDEGYATHMGRELIARCNAKNIPIYWCGGADARVRDSGLNGTVLYEFVNYFKTSPDGTVQLRYPPTKAYLEKVTK